jgi:RNA recognition motif-containing protein
MKKIYVGNLPFTATESDVRALFSPHGVVHSISLATHRSGDLPRGFGHIEIDDEAAAGAIQALNGYTMSGHRLMVNEARPPVNGSSRTRNRCNGTNGNATEGGL